MELISELSIHANVTTVATVSVPGFIDKSLLTNRAKGTITIITSVPRTIYKRHHGMHYPQTQDTSSASTVYFQLFKEMC